MSNVQPERQPETPPATVMPNAPIEQAAAVEPIDEATEVEHGGPENDKPAKDKKAKK